MDFAGLAKPITTYWTTTYELAISQPHQALPMISIAGIDQKIKNALSSRTARSWLLQLWWNWKEVRKGIYKDGHERENVKHEPSLLHLRRLKSQHLGKSWSLSPHPPLFPHHGYCLGVDVKPSTLLF